MFVLDRGLSQAHYLLVVQDRDEYIAHCEGIVDSLRPGSDLESRLAQAIAGDYWRIDRFGRTEQKLLNNAHNVEQAMLLNLVNTYESRINRNLRNNLAELRKLKAERKAEEAVAETVSPQPKPVADQPAEPLAKPINGFGVSKPKQPEPTPPETPEFRPRGVLRQRKSRLTPLPQPSH